MTLDLILNDIAPFGLAIPVNLLHDLYTPDAVAPLADGAINPGPGRYDFLADTGNQISRTAGKLRVSGGSGALNTRSRWLDGSSLRWSRQLGLTYRQVVRFDDLTGTMEFGFYNGTPGSGLVTHGWLASNATTGPIEAGLSTGTNETQIAGVDWVYSIVLKDTGALYFVAGEYYPRLAWDNNKTVTTTPLAPGFYSSSREFYFGDGISKGTDLFVYPGMDSADTFKSLIVDNPVSGQSYETSGNGDQMQGSFMADITITAPNPLSGSVEFRYRYQDSSNYWCAKLDSAGAYTLFYVENGSASSNYRNIAGVISAGQTITLRVATFENVHRVNTWNGTSWVGRGADNATFVDRDACSLIVPVFTGYTIAKIEVTPITSGRYGWIGQSRTGLSFMTIGDSKTSGNAWLSTLQTNLQTATGRTWKQLPIHMAKGGRSVITWDGDFSLFYTHLAQRTPIAPTHILVNLGVNDMGSTPPDQTAWTTRYAEILDGCHAKYPIALIHCSKPWRRGYADQSNLLAGWIDSVVASRPWSSVSDDEAIWLENGDNGATYTTDGVHYSADGQTKKAQMMQAAMGY